MIASIARAEKTSAAPALTAMAETLKGAETLIVLRPRWLIRSLQAREGR
jgi:hypothetical protein